MALPVPQPGLVVGYEFLFREDADAGLENARKPHPAAIILTLPQGEQMRVSLVAISHSPPGEADTAHHLQLTAQECRAMGLDHGDHWINLRDINSFDWPGYDLARSAPDGGYVYGRMSRAAFVRLVDALKACRTRIMSRD